MVKESKFTILSILPYFLRRNQTRQSPYLCGAWAPSLCSFESAAEPCNCDYTVSTENSSTPITAITILTQKDRQSTERYTTSRAILDKKRSPACERWQPITSLVFTCEMSFQKSPCGKKSRKKPGVLCFLACGAVPLNLSSATSLSHTLHGT